MNNDKKFIGAFLHLSNALEEISRQIEYSNSAWRSTYHKCAMGYLKAFNDNIAELLLKHDESKQPQPPDFANTALGEVSQVVNDQPGENLKAVEGATPVVRQNEQTKKPCPVCGGKGTIKGRKGEWHTPIRVCKMCGGTGKALAAAAPDK